MILEAFSDFLKQQSPPALPQQAVKGGSAATPYSRGLLEAWLHAYLLDKVPAQSIAQNHLRRSIQTEFTLMVWQGQTWVAPTSASGRNLLATLHHYADSYDQWQFARWVHAAQASDF